MENPNATIRLVDAYEAFKRIMTLAPDCAFLSPETRKSEGFEEIKEFCETHEIEIRFDEFIPLNQVIFLNTQVSQASLLDRIYKPKWTPIGYPKI